MIEETQKIFWQRNLLEPKTYAGNYFDEELYLSNFYFFVKSLTHLPNDVPQKRDKSFDLYCETNDLCLYEYKTGIKWA